MKSELINTSRLKSNTGQIPGLPKNPRLIKDEKFDKLKKSIQDDPEMLELREVIAYEFNGELVVIAGNMRLKACTELGIKQIPTKILPPTTPIEKLKAYTIKDNIGYGDHNWPDLQIEWDVQQLSEWGLDIPDAFKVVPEAVEDDYEIPDEITTDIVLGDLFEIGEHRLMCGDSTDSDAVAKLMNGEKADMVFTDPPYGMNFQSNFREKTPQFSKIKNDDKILDIAPILFFLMKDNSPAYVCTRWDLYPIWFNQMADSFNIKNCIVWYKKGGGLGDLKNSYSPNHEFIIVGHKGNSQLKGKRNSDVWEIGRDGVNDYKHPTQKPVELSSFAMQNHSYNNGLIVDLFLGSGSTMVAAHQLNRKCYGMELDPKYCQVIIDRMLKLDPSLTILKNGLPL